MDAIKHYCLLPSQQRRQLQGRKYYTVFKTLDRESGDTGSIFGRGFLSALGLVTEGQIYTVSRGLVTQQPALQAALQTH